MAEEITAGNYIIVLKTNRSTNFSAKEIIAFEKDGTIFIKRLAALPEDTVYGIGNEMLINSINYPLDSVTLMLPGVSEDGYIVSNWVPYFKYLFKKTSESLYNSNKNLIKESLFIVPTNYFFVIGDNYFESMDSRFWGFVHKDQIIGKVITVF